MDKKSILGIAITLRWILGAIPLLLSVVLLLVMVLTYPYLTLYEGVGMDSNSLKFMALWCLCGLAFCLTFLLNLSMLVARNKAIYPIVVLGYLSTLWIALGISGIPLRPEAADRAWDVMLWYFGLSLFNSFYEAVYASNVAKDIKSVLT